MWFCFWGGIKAPVSKTGCSEGILVPRQGTGELWRMQPFLPAVLTSPAPTPSPSIPLSPSHWDFPLLHFAHSLHSCPQPLPFLTAVCPSLSFISLFLCFCVSINPPSPPSAGPKPQGPAWLPSSCADSGCIPGSPLLLSALHNVSGALRINKDFRVCQLQ